MAAEIMGIAREACPAARLIRRRYEGAANWSEWWENGWFETLEKTPALTLARGGKQASLGSVCSFRRARRLSRALSLSICRRPTMPCALFTSKAGSVP